MWNFYLSYLGSQSIFNLWLDAFHSFCKVLNYYLFCACLLFPGHFWGSNYVDLRPSHFVLSVSFPFFCIIFFPFQGLVCILSSDLSSRSLILFLVLLNLLIQSSIEFLISVPVQCRSITDFSFSSYIFFQLSTEIPTFISLIIASTIFQYAYNSRLELTQVCFSCDVSDGYLFKIIMNTQ